MGPAEAARYILGMAGVVEERLQQPVKAGDLDAILDRLQVK
jgi:hypothetical protein